MGCICSRESIEINGIKYFVLDSIDGGGFSTIYLVEQHGSKKQFAVKKMICHAIEDEKIALQEVEYHNLLSHPNILPCLDHSLTSKGIDPALNNVTVVYMLLPYYKLGTIEKDLKMREKTSFQMKAIDALKLFIQICEGIKVFHNFRPTPLAHRDIKPSNILLSADGSPVIMDLGSVSPAIVFVKNSSEAQKLQDYASTRCTITYRAPELFNVEVDATIDQRTDIWSLGCLLYALCFYKSPFDYVHEKGDSVALAVVSGRINFPSESPYPEVRLLTSAAVQCLKGTLRTINDDGYIKVWSIHNLILSMLKIDPAERPFIDEVKLKANTILSEFDSNVAC